MAEESKQAEFAFGKKNYIIMGVGILLIIAGYLLMMGGEPVDKSVFDESEIYSTTRITISPILILVGLGLQIPAIMLKND